MHKKILKILCCLLVIMLILGGYSYWALQKPWLSVKPITSSSVLSATPVKAAALSWPSGVQAAVTVDGSQNVITNGPQTPAPTASTAKLVAALVILKAKPLSLNQPGPTITLTASDVAIYNTYVAEQGSVVRVQAGESISEYQMLQAMLLPSANNMADSLAIWAYGSLSNYSQTANAFLAAQNLTETHIGTDASGFLPSTTSTAHDLVMIGELALKNPVLAQIVGQSKATNFPVVGTIYNVNSLIGKINVIGIKTGNTDQAGGVFVSASQVVVNKKPLTIITAVMKSPTLSTALSTSVPLIESAQTNFQQQTVIKSGAVVGRYILPWNNQVVNVVANQDLDAYIWNGQTILPQVDLHPITKPVAAGGIVGQATIQSDYSNNHESVNLVITKAINKPPVLWRLLHAI